MIVYHPPPTNSSFGSILLPQYQRSANAGVFTNHCFPLFLAIPSNCKTLPCRTLFFALGSRSAARRFSILHADPDSLRCRSVSLANLVYSSVLSLVPTYMAASESWLAGEGKIKALCGDASAPSTACGGVGSPGGIHIARGWKVTRRPLRQHTKNVSRWPEARL